MSAGPTLILKNNLMTDDELSSQIFNMIFPEEEYGKIKYFHFTFLTFANPYNTPPLDGKPIILFNPDRERRSAKTWSTGDNFGISFDTVELAKQMWDKIKRIIIGKLGYPLRGNENFEEFKKIGFTFQDLDYTQVSFFAEK